MRVLISLLSLSALLLLALILYFTLKLHATFKLENHTGISKSKDLWFTNPTTIKLEPCNESDPSLVCCPHDEKRGMLKTYKIVTNNHSKRIPGEKAKEMCEIYGKTAYRNFTNPAIKGPEFLEKLVCKLEKPLIKGGQDAKEGEFPHMVQIGYGCGKHCVQWQCGGSLVSPEFILSAAHCYVSNKNGYAMFGTNRIENTNEFCKKHIISINDVFIHPHYNPNNNNHDIALYKLSTKLGINERPICLDTGSPLTNLTVIATGFGLNGLNKEQKSRKVLQKVSLNIVEQGSCSRKYKEVYKNSNITRDLPEYPVCAYAEGKDTCSGDSGGPIQIAHNNLTCMFTIIGVTSFGINCNRDTNLPSIYTYVAPYIGWIEDIVWPA